MKAALFLFLFLAVAQNPKNDPNGIWESASGTQFDLKLTGSDLHVRIADGSSSRYSKYEVELKNGDDPNIYRGQGYFVAKMPNGKECKFSTDWEVVVVAANHIVGSSTSIIPDPETCQVKEQSQVQLELKKK